PALDTPSGGAPRRRQGLCPVKVIKRRELERRDRERSDRFAEITLNEPDARVEQLHDSGQRAQDRERDHRLFVNGGEREQGERDCTGSSVKSKNKRSVIW